MYNWLFTSSSWMLTLLVTHSPQPPCMTELSKHILTKTENKPQNFGTLAQKLCYYVTSASGCSSLAPKTGSQSLSFLSLICVCFLSEQTLCS